MKIGNVNMHSAFGKTERFRMADTFAGLAGNETVMIRGASLWRDLLIILGSLFDQQLLKTYCLPGAMPVLETEE